MKLYEWKIKWNISDVAMDELQEIVLPKTANIVREDRIKNESDLMREIRLEASEVGARLWRNNVGVISDGTTYIRYGLANDSHAINKICKSADLIGIRPIKITKEHLGCVIGQFISREVKHPEWTYKATERERAQVKWAEIINILGGDAQIVNKKGTL